MAVDLHVDVFDRLPDAAAWDDVVQASGAPLFYRARVLRSYQRHILLPGVVPYYILARNRRSGQPVAVLPVYLTPPMDPLGALTRLYPSYATSDRPLLLSHFWHWYDTHLPSRDLSAAVVECLCSAVGGVARELGAQAYGLVNVASDNPVCSHLRGCGMRGNPIHARYRIPLSGFDCSLDYIGNLRPRVRQEVRRHLRLAERAGAVVSVGVPTEVELTEAARLCKLTAAKHNNAEWYEPTRLYGFLDGFRSDIRLVSVRMADRVVASSISFVDGTRFHNWAGGTERLGSLPFSPYIVLLVATLSAAIAAGCAVLEGGRSNDHWKERLGMQRTELWGWLGSATTAGGSAPHGQSIACAQPSGPRR
jgi:hypothetical protein